MGCVCCCLLLCLGFFRRQCIMWWFSWVLLTREARQQLARNCLGPPVVPFYPYLGAGSPTKIHKKETSGCPSSSLSTGAPRNETKASPSPRPNCEVPESAEASAAAAEVPGAGAVAEALKCVEDFHAQRRELEVGESSENPALFAWPWVKSPVNLVHLPQNGTIGYTLAHFAWMLGLELFCQLTGFPLNH